jgi:putative endonuclease
MMRDPRQPCVYILASRRYGTLYTGVTSNLMGRIWQHRELKGTAFTSRHSVLVLVWYEMHDTMDAAITREKRIKKWNRQWRIDLIETENPDWRDLAVDLGFAVLPTRFLVPSPVIATTAEIHPSSSVQALDPRFRGGDEGGVR